MSTPPTPCPDLPRLPLPHEAIAWFKAMARSESGKADDNSPRLRAKHPKVQNARNILVQFNLSEPKGDHDHYLFKSVEDDEGKRKYAGRRRPQDYQVGRAWLIDYIKEALIDPDLTLYDKDHPFELAYVLQVASDFVFFVLVHQRETGEPKYSLTTAYPMTPEEWAVKRRGFKLLWRK